MHQIIARVKDKSFLLKLRFTLNLIFVLYNGTLGIIYNSLWFISLFFYYLILSFMRIASIIGKRQNDVKKECFLAKLIGIYFLVLSFILSGIVYISISEGISTRYHEIVMITISAFTFYKVILAIINAVKCKGNKTPLLWVLNCISYGELSVSVLTMQRSMLVSFGDMNTDEIKILNICTSTAVVIFVIYLGIFIIMKGNKMMASIKETNEKIAEKVTEAYKTVESTVVGGYKKIEDTFVDKFLKKDDETIEEAKQRLKDSK